MNELKHKIKRFYSKCVDGEDVLLALLRHFFVARFD